MDTRTLLDALRRPFVVLGVGNDLRGDDAAGSLVARALIERCPDRAFDGGQAPENYLGPLRRAGAETVLLVDAADFGGAPGEIRFLNPDDVESAGIATHGAPLGMLMRALSDELGVATMLLAVQAGQTRLGAPMSDEVRAACDEIIEGLSRALDARSDPTP
ncbi:MAG: hydrogenase maturation protease [Candidatus Eisenbacteria bacterium]|nr:hydrogenase maturation protease [Candidatus Eisenbacteria bacterium]